MTRSFEASWKTDDGLSDGAVDVDQNGVIVYDEIGGSSALDWGQWDRLVAEVGKLRPLVTDEAA